MEKLINLLDKIYKDDNTKDGAKFFIDNLTSKEIDVHFGNDTILKYAILWRDKELTDILIKEYDCDLYKRGNGYPSGPNIKACVNYDDFDVHDYEFLMYLLENYVDFSTVNKDIMKELILNALYDRYVCEDNEKIQAGTEIVIKYMIDNIKDLEITISDVIDDFGFCDEDIAIKSINYLHQNAHLKISEDDIKNCAYNCKNVNDIYCLLSISSIINDKVDISYIENMLGKIVIREILDEDSKFYYENYIMQDLLSAIQEYKKKED